MDDRAVPLGSGAVVVNEGPSGYRGLDLTVVALKRAGWPFRAYVHTPGWGRVVAVSTGSSADTARERAETLLAQAVERGVVAFPTEKSPMPAQAEATHEAA